MTSAVFLQKAERICWIAFSSSSQEGISPSFPRTWLKNSCVRLLLTCAVTLTQWSTCTHKNAIYYFWLVTEQMNLKQELTILKQMWVCTCFSPLFKRPPISTVNSNTSILASTRVYRKIRIIFFFVSANRRTITQKYCRCIRDNLELANNFFCLYLPIFLAPDLEQSFKTPSSE